MQFTNKGADKFGEITNDEADRGKALYNISGGGGDPRNTFQHFAIVLDREIKSWPSIDWEQYPNGISGTNGAQITGIGDLTEAKNLALVLQTGALPVTFTTLAADRNLGHARQGLARGGLEGRDRGPPRRRALPARLLPRARRRRRDRPRHLRRLPLRGDPALQRHADPAGLRRDDPDAGGGRRREHRHLRAREGGVPRREVGARRDRGGLRQGLRDDHRRKRRHGDHRRRPLPRRDRRREGLRADAADRNADVAADRGRGDARDPRPARRLPLVRQPEADGRRGRAAGVDPARLHRPAEPLVRDLRRRPGDLARRDRDQRAQPRHRLRGRHADHAHDARSRTSLEDVRAEAADERRRAARRSRAPATRWRADKYKEFRIRTDARRRPSRRA